MIKTLIDKFAGIREWRCPQCGKLLGQLLDGRMHLQLSRGRSYLVGFPVTTSCTHCRALSEVPNARALIEAPTPALATR